MTNVEELYQTCKGSIEELLRALERNDLNGVQREVYRIRQQLASRPLPGETDLRGLARFRMEQLEAIDGVTEAIEISLRSLRRSTRDELERIRHTESLLAHLVQPMPRHVM